MALVVDIARNRMDLVHYEESECDKIHSFMFLLNFVNERRQCANKKDQAYVFGSQVVA